MSDELLGLMEQGGLSPLSYYFARFVARGSDAGMVKIFGDLAAEGEYRVLSRVWQGQNDAEGLIAQAEAHAQAARDAKVMGLVNTVTTAFSTYLSAGGTFGKPATETAISADGLPYSPSASRPKTTLWDG